MLNEFSKYHYFRKSKSELATDEIMDNLSRKLWNDSGYDVAYYLGIINYLTNIVKYANFPDSFTKEYLKMCIASFKDSNDVPNEIKSLVDVVLEELKEKEN